DVPLVLHGSSGVADADLAHAFEAGMTKVNVSTHLNKEFTRAARTHLDAHPETVDPRTYVGPARDAVAGEVAHLLKVLHGGLGGRRRPRAPGRSFRGRPGTAVPAEPAALLRPADGRAGTTEAPRRVRWA